MEYADYQAWVKTTRYQPAPYLNALCHFGIAADEIQAAFAAYPERLINIARRWRSGDSSTEIIDYINLVEGVAPLMDRVEDAPVEAVEIPSSLETKAARPVRAKGAGRPKGSKNTKGLEHPWVANVVKYSVDVLPAVQDILWRRGSLRISEILDCISIEEPGESSWCEAESLTVADVRREIHNAANHGKLIKKGAGGQVKGITVERFEVCGERTGWYWKGKLVSAREISRHSSLHQDNVNNRLKSGWDVEAARLVEGGKGAAKKRGAE